MNQIRKTELSIATGIFLLLIFFLLYRSISYNVFELQHEYGYKFGRYHQVFDYYKHYLLPLMAHIAVVYLAFLAVHLWIIPRYYEEERWKMGSLFLAIVTGVVFLTVMVASTWYNGYLFGVYKTVQGVHTHCAKSAFIITIFYATLYALYYAGRHMFLVNLYPKIISSPWFRETRTELLCIAVILVMLTATGFRQPVAMAMLFITGCYLGAMYLVLMYVILPKYYNRLPIRRLTLWVALMSISAFALILFYAIVVTRLTPAMFVLGSITYFVTVLLLYPLTIWIYRIRHAHTNTILGLQKALNKSETGLDFLRWQINPHFLFNALNTLYGTALQEKAGATSEGIQKLGDMMRFMLHDNLLEKISLSKEIAYLENYISLQRLRTQASPDILIEVNINDEHCEHEIAPMLLIPFVENAFKHGVSLRHKSRIILSLSCTPEKIYFDISNTVHNNRGGEVEKESMGIGLHNVQQRLALLYPNRHELNIRETTTEFFVHLTIEIV
ncbi:MAG TPA: histidine kinase [Chitinophaga sp.]|nr:histidine kinase [Chitinophaga sp.]